MLAQFWELEATEFQLKKAREGTQTAQYLKHMVLSLASPFPKSFVHI